MINALQLEYVETRPHRVGDRRRVDFDLYAATLLWDGQEREVLVLATGGEPLIGMALLRGYQLFIDVIDGGPVTIESRP